jgi:hypothetical protein
MPPPRAPMRLPTISSALLVAGALVIAAALAGCQRADSTGAAGAGTFSPYFPGPNASAVPSPAVSAAPTPTARVDSSGSPSLLTQTRAAVDLGNGVHFSAITASSHSLYGRFSFAKTGVGLFWSSGATVAPNPDGTLRVRYSGPGELDPNADLSIYLGLHRQSGTRQPVQLDLDVTLGLRDGSGAGRLIANGTTYELRAAVQPPSLDAAVAEVLALTKRGAWGALYDRFTPQFQSAIGRQQFEDAMRRGLADIGAIVEVRADAPSTVKDHGAWFAATVPLTVTIERNGVRATYPSRVVLVAVGNEWRIDTIDRIGPTPTASPR